MSRLKIGIIGTGGISHAHMRGYNGNTDLAEVVAVADIDADVAKKAADEWGVSKHFSDYRKILDMPEIDAVSVCTYNTAHREPTVAALDAGKHVLCEKPMAASLQDAAAMTAATQRSGKILMIAFHSRFRADQLAAKRVVESGFMGRVYYGEVTTCRRRGAGGGTFQKSDTAGAGTVVDIGVYQLDTALDILGHPKPVRVSATTELVICPDPSSKVEGMSQYAGWDPDVIDVEEFGAAWIRFEGGLCLVFKSSWAIHGNSMGRPFFLGEKGGLSLSPLEAHTDMFGSMVDITPTGLQGPEDGFVAEIKAFLEAVHDGKPSPIPPEQVIQTNVIMDGLYRSVAEEQEVAVAPWQDAVAAVG
ncbi:MAG: Gfo/Idh/MocA family oxidoreductase [Candidatus Latescibacteria bacterium]|nr:Gfo/Idh/MocA family oxidoreductase [Candidatus Latescibacterota bacterium]